MATFLRILRLYALTAWVGGLIFFIIVAAIAFSVLPDAHSAGLIVRSSLLAIHRIGIYAAILYLLTTLALVAVQRDHHPVRAAELALALIMLSLTLYSQLSIIPRMETDRISLGGDVQAASQTLPAARDFNRLHARSVHVESTVLLAGLILIALAPVHGRTHSISSSSLRSPRSVGAHPL
jgi:hypothetical protein